MNPTTQTTNQGLTNRYDFVFFVDVVNGNPNGNPDAGNMPRQDPETSQGLLSDVCIKRKIRNYVSIIKAGQPGYEIYVKEKAILAATQSEAYRDLGLEDTPEPEEEEAEDNGKRKKKVSKKLADQGTAEKARDYMVQRFYDCRTFGAVMSTKEANCGQVRGPVQITFSRSIDLIAPVPITMTRLAVATRKESEEQGGANRTMGRKWIVPYALYMGMGFVSPTLAKQTGFGTEDLALLWESFQHMWDFDRSAARGLMSLRKLIVFKHSSFLGNAPANVLFDAIRVSTKEEGLPPRSFADYRVSVVDEDLPPGIEYMVYPIPART